jgi:rhodanese-related sulfurtransferase
MSTHKSKRKAQKETSPSPILLAGGVVLAVGLIVAAVFFLTRNGQETTALPMEIDVEKAVAMREAGAFILDVRTVEEWNEFHIPDSTLIPLDQLASRVSEVPSDKEVVVVCRSGNRSQQGRDILLEAGLTRVASMAGGVTEWRGAGHPTVSGP